MDNSDLTADLSDTEVNSTQESENMDEVSHINPSLANEENRRLSASQPILTSQSSVHKKNTNKKPNERFPFLKVQEDNERLQSRVIELDSALRDAKTRQRFAEEQLAKPVQEVIEDYCNLQRIIRDGQDKVKDYDNLTTKYEKLQQENVKLQRYINENVKSYELRLSEKDNEIERLRHDIFAGEEFTLRSDADADPINKTIAIELNQQKILNSDYLKKIDKLENELTLFKERLVASENVQNANATVENEETISRTLSLSEKERELTHRLDELLSQHTDLKSRYVSCNECLIQYMNKVNSLERKLMNAGLSSSQFNLSSSFDVLDKSRVISLLEKMKMELLNERDKNKFLRREVNHLMGRDASRLSEESVEDAAEAIDAVELDDAVDQEKEVILKEAQLVLADLKKRGWIDKTQNESLDICESFANVPAIDLGVKDSELVAKCGSTAGFIPETMEHVSLLNTSMGQFLQTSMNAAADITSLKENLGDFRKVLVTMFERLKSSAALFDEIRLLFANGEHNPLADKISAMQIMWNTAKEEAEQITKAVDIAERSIVGLQAHISVLEQSILQTSFVLDHTRRMTLSNVSMLSHIGQGEPSVLTAENLKAEVNELAVELKEVANARDAANSRAELLEKHLNAYSDNMKEVQMKCDQLMEEKERLKAESTHLTDSLAMAMSDLEHQKSLLCKTSQRLHEAQENNVNLNCEIATLKSSIDSLEATREELCIRVANLSQDLHTYSAVIAQKEEDKSYMAAKTVELNNTIEQLQKALTSARVTINDKENELDRLQEESQAMVNQLSEQLEAARNNAAELQTQISQIAFKQENGLRTNSTWSPTRTGSSPNSSLLYKSTMPQKYVQTDLSAEEIAAVEAEVSNVELEFKKLMNVYNRLETALHPFLFNSAADFRESRDVNAAQHNYDKFLRGLREKAIWETKTNEQIEKLEQELHNRTGASNTKTKTATFKKTPIDAEYKDKLRKDIYAALSMIMDLTYNLKVAEGAYKKGYQFDLAVLVDDARQIRTLLDDLRRYSQFDKENMPQDMTECHSLINRLSLEVKQKYYELQQAYEQLRNKVTHNPNDPKIVGKIDKELGRIHEVLKNVQVNPK